MGHMTEGGRIIIYCTKYTDVRLISNALIDIGVPTKQYYGEMSDTDRADAYRSWKESPSSLTMVATSSFGLGKQFLC